MPHCGYLDWYGSVVAGCSTTNPTNTQKIKKPEGLSMSIDRPLTRSNLYQINPQPSKKEVCHLSRPIEKMIQEVGDANIVYLWKILPAYPNFAVYCVDHHFHDDGYEHIVLDTEILYIYSDLIYVLIHDCHFEIQTFIAQDTDGVARPVSVRERAAEIMGKIKEIDEKDTLRILDPHLAAIKKKTH
jgi:hypothetical protein